MSKYFLGKLLTKAIKSIPRSKKVSPDIKSIPPTKDIKGSVERGKTKEYLRRIDKLDAAQKKVREGKKMMQEGQRVRKGMKDTRTAFQFKNIKSYHPLKPGDKPKYKIKKGIAGGK